VFLRVEFERNLNFVLGALCLDLQLSADSVQCQYRTKNKVQKTKIDFAMNIRSILLPTDFSECGNYALSYAASLARTFKASIICLNVIEPIVPTVGYSGMTEPMPIADIAEQLEDSAERELPKLAECDECAGLNVEEMVAHGEAASEIVRVAKERAVDLIVIASHGRTGLGRILFGSTAEAVVRHAACPVLVVKPPPIEEGQQ
jgi:nucleotide-binding universal stress UspA family protein